MSVSGDVADAANRIQGGTASDADRNLVAMHYGNLNSAQIGAVAQGNVPEGFGGDNLTVNDWGSITDRELAGVGSTITERDVALAEANVRAGREAGLAECAGGLDKTLQNAEYARAADNQTMMNGYACEKPEQTKARLEEEAKQKGEEKGGFLSQIMGYATMIGAMFGLGKAASEGAALAGNTLNASGVKYAGISNMSMVEYSGPDMTPGIAQQQQVSRGTSEGWVRSQA